MLSLRAGWGLAVVVIVGLGSTAGAGEPAREGRKLVPVLEGEWRPIAGQPDLGPLSGERQQPVDFAVWQAADGTWQLWSCIRGTKCGGKSRLFHRWEGKRFEDANWEPKGIAMQADPAVGETAGGLQAPHVIRWQGKYVMAYGDWQHIAIATSEDGKTFTRVKSELSGVVGVFDEGPGAHARDAMLLPVGDGLLCYYTAYPGKRGAVYARKWIEGDLRAWGPSRVVAFGGAAGSDPYSAECPHVVEREGMYYLFRTQKYGRGEQTTVYRSADPLQFGVEGDQYRVGTLPVAAPEIVRHEGQDWLFALNPGLDGIRVVKLGWKAE